MSPFVQKVTPFFEHIVIGLGFASMGYLFFWTFNTSFLSILGMAAICFGGLKILIGMVIYILWLFALIFRPGYLRKKEEEEREAQRKNENVKAPFFPKYWGTIVELGILVTGFLIIVITRSGL